MSTMCEMVEGFSRPGAVAFLKVRDKDTPKEKFPYFLSLLDSKTFVLSHNDIPSKGAGVYPELPPPHHDAALGPKSGPYQIPDTDARFPDVDDSPPTVMLDFMYGAAAYATMSLANLRKYYCIQVKYNT